MKQKFKDILFKKEKGDAGVVSAAMLFAICLVAMTCMILWFTGWLSNFDKKNQIDSIVRDYSLKMETTGYLTSEQQVQLRNALGDIGCTDIAFDAETPLTEDARKAYGEDILLGMTFKVTYHTFSLHFDSVEKTDTAKETHVSRLCTSKY